MGEGVFIFKEIISRLVSKRPFDGSQEYLI